MPETTPHRTYRRIYPPPVVAVLENPTNSVWRDLSSPFDLSSLAAARLFESPTFEPLSPPASLMKQLEPLRREFQWSNRLNAAGLIVDVLVLVFVILAFLVH